MERLPEYSKISPTAKMVAYWRALSDIPYAKDVAELMHSSEVMETLLRREGLTLDSLRFLAPFAEARSKALVAALHREGATQVLELASGLSLRGLVMTEDPGLTYVETDLPGIMEEKARIVATIRRKYDLPVRPNLHFKTVNALHPGELEAAASVFEEGRPIAVINEGLFMYFTMDEKAEAAGHIRGLLERYGGVWITPDFSVREGSRVSETEAGAKLIKLITGATQRDLTANSFETARDVTAFFTKLGFAVDEAPLDDGSFGLASLGPTGLGRDVLASFRTRLWTLRVG